jgi:hypothetical protein
MVAGTRHAAVGRCDDESKEPSATRENKDNSAAIKTVIVKDSQKTKEYICATLHQNG